MLPFPSRDVRGCVGAPQHTTNYLYLFYVYIYPHITPGHRICFPINREAVTFNAAIGRAAPRLLPGLNECASVCVRLPVVKHGNTGRLRQEGTHTPLCANYPDTLTGREIREKARDIFFFFYFYCCCFCCHNCSLAGLIWTFNETNLREKIKNRGLDCSTSAQFYIATAVNVVLDYFARMCF